MSESFFSPAGVCVEFVYAAALSWRFDLPGFDVLQHLVSSFALIEPRVSTVSHQLTPLYTLLHQESLEGVVT